MQPSTYTNISFVYDRDENVFIYMDEAFAIFSKKDREKITPALLLSMVHPDDKEYVQLKLQELLTGTLNSCLELRVLLAKKTHWIRLTPFLYQADGKNLLATHVADITAEWNNADMIRKYANKKNSILNMLAHDLRGPLDVAHTLAKAIDRKIDDPKLVKMTGSIAGILNQSIQLITDLINRELLDTIEVELSMSRVDIVLKLAEYIEECKKSESAADRDFKFASTRDSIYIELDESKFMQVINNIITNALKFTSPGGKISVGIEERKHSVLFSIRDDGIGIPREMQPQLFDKFTPARRKGLNGEPTIGLGLYIVKTIVEWHKGKVWCESEENIGSAFFFELPKANAKGE